MAHSCGWNRSIILSAANRDMLRVIAEREPESLDALVALTGRATSNLSRTLKAMIAHGIGRMERSGRKLAPKVIYDAIEASVGDLDDPALKERIAGLKVIRD